MIIIIKAGIFKAQNSPVRIDYSKRIHAYVRAHPHTHKHARTHTHTHTHTHTGARTYEYSDLTTLAHNLARSGKHLVLFMRLLL